MPAFTRRSPHATHRCAVCTRAISASLLMCATHWRLVPHEHQRAVNATWQQYREATLGGMFSARREYLAARDAAVDAVTTALNPATTGATAP